MSKPVFILGNNTAEMEVIAAILSQIGLEYLQPRKDGSNHEYTPANLGYEELSRNTYVPASNPAVSRIPTTEFFIKGEPTMYFAGCTPKAWPDGTVAGVVNEDDQKSSIVLQVLDIIEDLPDLSISTKHWARIVAANYFNGSSWENA